jgi:O-antigen/teichoic acid export membrane protein
VSLESPAAARSLPGRGFLDRGRLRTLLASRFAGSMSIVTVSMAARLAMQLVTFAIVAGAMGPSQFGAFATVAALAALISTFSGWGAEQLLLRRVGRARHELARATATGFAFLALSAPPLVLLSMLIVPLVVDRSISWQVVLCVAVADIAMVRVNSIAASCYQAVGRPLGYAWLDVGFGATRAVAALLWIAIAETHDAQSWSFCYVGVSILAAAASAWRIRRDFGPPDWTIAWGEWRDGFQFALQMASFAAFGSTDKPVVAALSDLSTAGLYAAASRIALAAAIPVKSLLYSAYVQFFQVGVAGPRSSAKLAVRLLPLGISLGALGMLATMLAAPLAPRILGPAYIGTDAALMLLAPTPVFYAAYCLALDVLVSTGRTSLRTLAQIAMPPVNIFLCWLFVPGGGAAGAALAALTTNILLAAAGWTIVGLLVRRQAPRQGSERA